MEELKLELSPNEIPMEAGPNRNQVRTIGEVVGSQIRNRRMFLGLSRVTVANAMKLPRQQLEKYENGTNEISASRLYQLSNILDTPISYFFETVKCNLYTHAPNLDNFAFALPENVMKLARTQALVAAFYQIKSSTERAAFLKWLSRQSARASANEAKRT